MTGFDVITRHLKQLRMYLERLNELQKHSREQMMTDWQTQSVVERNLQLAVEVVISISQQIISSLSLPTPDSGREAIVTLAKAGIITQELGAMLEDAVRFRNVLVHQYLEIDYAKVYRVLQEGPADFKEFARQISIFLLSQDQS
jgi:uncharacterized protein YutE (UPF0331/DUF86 family)